MYSHSDHVTDSQKWLIVQNENTKLVTFFKCVRPQHLIHTVANSITKIINEVH